MNQCGTQLAAQADALEAAGSASNIPPWSVSRDFPAICLLAALILAVMLPVLALHIPTLRNDGANEDVPRLIAVAGHMQKGAIPLWDFQTFAGGKPFYADDAAILYYPPMIPFYLLARTDDMTQCSLMLILIPYTLHLLWAGAGGYVFARIVLRLHPVGGFVTGLLWALSPGLLTSFESLSCVYFLSYLPWIATCIIRYLEKGGLRVWTAGVLLGVMAISLRTTNYLIREYFVLGMMAALFVLFQLRWNLILSSHGAAACGYGGRFLHRISGKGLNLRRVLGALAMIAFSLGINSLPLAGVGEGLQWVVGANPMTYETASNLTRESSTPPMFFLSLLIPDFFGVLDTRHGWGLTLTEGVSAVSLAGGGMCVMTTVLAAMLFWLPKRDAQGQDRNLQIWTWIATLLLALMLLTVMGRYTPAFKWLCVVLPWFFRFPHAVYYRFGICWSLAMLAGIGASGYWSKNEFRQQMARWWVPGLGVAAGLAGAGFELLRRTPLQIGPQTAQMVPGYRTLSAYGEWTWFLSGPMLYFGIASLLLLAGFTLLTPTWRVRVLMAGIVVETLGMGAMMTYVCNVAVQVRTWPDLQSKSVDGRYRTMADYPPRRMAERMSDLSSGGDVRWVCQSSVFDNQVWSTGGRALLGYACKPVLPNVQPLAERFTRGWPYRLELTEVPTLLLQNMNVGYVVLLQRPGTSNNLRPIDDTFSYAEVPAPLPYVYTQDRFAALPNDEQLDRLFRTDLRQSVLVTPEVSAEIGNHAGKIVLESLGTDFPQLQASNSVKATRSGPNRTIVTADIAKPAMLVIAESWHPGWRATVSGHPVPLWQVNYLQQGLWLPPGRHTVELSFAPDSMRYGLWLSIGFGGVFFCILVIGWATSVRSKRAQQANPRS